MKKLITLTLLSFLLLSIASCMNFGNANGIGPEGFLVSQYKIGTSGNTVAHTRSAESCVHRISVLFTFGGEDVAAIAAKSQITQITSVNKEVLSVLSPSIYGRLCTVVSGN